MSSRSSPSGGSGHTIHLAIDETVGTSLCARHETSALQIVRSVVHTDGVHISFDINYSIFTHALCRYTIFRLMRSCGMGFRGGNLCSVAQDQSWVTIPRTFPIRFGNTYVVFNVGVLAITRCKNMTIL